MSKDTRGQSVEARKKRTAEVTRLLKKAYPTAKIVLRYRNHWELLVSVVLSAQCTDVMVNKVTEKLFSKYKTLNDYIRADIKEFEQDIKPTGFYHNKARNILASAKLVREKFGGNVPGTMAELLTLPSVARKTANIILGNAFGIVEGIAVDTHVHRVSQRLRLVDLDKIGGNKALYVTKNSVKLVLSDPELVEGESKGSAFIDYKKDADPRKIEQQLMEVVPKNEWFRLTYVLIDHGRAVCRAQNPDCSHCVLNRLCPASRV